MKRIHFALVTAMLCAATVSGCKREEPPAPEPAAVEPAPVEDAAMPAPVESVSMPAPASIDAADPGDMPHSGGDKVGTSPAAGAVEDDDTPHSGGDKVGGKP